MYHHPEKGTTVKPTQHDTKTPDATPGCFAMLCAPLRARRTGAPSPRSITINRAIVPCIALLAILSFSTSSALAAGEPSGEHIFSKFFAGAGSEPGQLSGPEGIAVNEGAGPQAGDVYVVDTGNKRVEVFSAGGAYLFEFNGSGAGLNEGKPAGSDGRSNEEATGRFHDPEHIAVDNDPSSPSYEDVYVVDNTTEIQNQQGAQIENYGGVVDKFSSSGAYLGQMTEEEHGARFDPHERDEGTIMCGVAVGHDGEVRICGTKRNVPEPGATGGFLDVTYIYGYTDEEQNRFSVQHRVHDGGCIVVIGETTVESTVESFCGKGPVTGLAVEPSSNDVYIDDGSTVDRYSEEGSLIESFGSGQLQSGSGVVESGQSGEVYVADATADVIDVYEVDKEPKAPAISEEQVTHVEATAATLQAKIDPYRAETSYHFEYDTVPYETSAAHGTSTPEVSVGSGERPVAVSVRLTGLAPGRTYYYRAVAANAVAPAGVDGPDKTLSTPAPASSGECPNEQLRAEQPYGLGLPDCRAYEMVSPLDKNGEGVEAGDARASVSNGGAGEGAPAIAYLSIGSFSEPKGAPEANRYISRREADGWSTQNVTPPQIARGQHSAPFAELLFTPELSLGLTQNNFVPLVEGEPAGYINLYVADFAAGSYQSATPVIPGVAPYRELSGEGASPLTEGASSDLSHVVFQEIRGNIFEWAGGKLSFVGSGGVGVAGYEASKLSWHAVSENGRRIFFTVLREENSNGGQLYVRENPEQQQSHLNSHGECTEPAGACTVGVSASQRTYPDSKTPNPDPNASKDPYAWYLDASADGERVFFTSRVELTTNADTGPEDNVANLYEYNLESKKLTDLTVPTAAEETKGEDPDGAAVVGFVNAGQNAGEENSYVYFVANGVLAEGAKLGNCPVNTGEAHQGETTCNLYVEHYSDGTWESPKFVATLAGSERGRVTPDGTTLAFVSERSLTGYDNEQAQPGECEGEGHEAVEAGETKAGRCDEVYLYDAGSSSHPPTLVCASCNPSGARPSGSSEFGGEEEEGFSNPSKLYFPRNLSEDGGRLFFQSSDALVPHTSDGKLNVYEWERPASAAEAAKAENSCTQAGGCVLAISDVAGAYGSKFMDATPNGDNVFIATQDQLVPSDTDTREDVYDVRVGGGFPATPAAPLCTNADSCKPPVSPQPGVFAAPGSATFSGAGNPVAPPPAVVKPKPVKKTVKCKKGVRHECKRKPKTKHKSARKAARRKSRRS